ncbi:MAG TPA: YceD family protein [Steroidobacteraceae bacterium]|jgi:uncharacterized protein|nr:YceD family protein [Steroidobacteraceae bacterium]
MPNGWSKARDLAKLAEMRAQFEFEIPLGDLPGIPEEFSLADGPVRVGLQFGRGPGLGVVHIKLNAVLRPLCQRCLSEMRLPIAADSQLTVVDSDAQAAAVPEEFETFLAPAGHCSLAALAAEELLLSLPIVPRHASDEHCLASGASVRSANAAPAVAEAMSPAQETQRPFADLRTLLERAKS